MTRQGSPGPASRRPWTALFDPRSVAVLGASDDPAKWGGILARRALESCGERPVVMVNRRADVVLGRPAVPSLVAHGAPVDLAVVCVPAAGLLEAVSDAVDAGARALVVITSGLSERGPEGRALEQQALAVTRAGGAMLVGPNCLGVADTSTSLQLSHAVLPPGPVSVLSQSGNVVLDLAGLLADRGLGVARFVSLGNQADVGVVDLLDACRDHEPTRAVAVYAEDVGDGRAFVTAARRLVDAGTPVVLLAPGRSEAAVRSAASHTGALTTAAHVVDAACRAAGVQRVENPTQLADALEALLGGRRLTGPRVAVLTDGGGHGAIAADALAGSGLDTPALAPETRTALTRVLGEAPSVENPVDLAGAGDRDPLAYARGATELLAADDVDGVIMTGYFGGYSAQPDPAAATALAERAAGEAIAAAVARHGKPLVVHSIFPDSPTSRVLRAAGIPVHRDIDRAGAALAVLRAGPLTPLPVLPAPARPVDDTSYDAARALFAAGGVRFPASVAVRGLADLDAALEATSYPVVLKATGTLHKSDAGGVLLDLADAASARAAYADLVTRLAPPSVSVEEMADLVTGVETIVGCVRDRVFGPVLLVGLGGVLTEVLADVVCALAPVSTAQARDLLGSLRGAALLTGVRGRVAVDLDALAATIAAFSRVVAAHPELAEAELNPVLALPRGCLALDARLVLDVAQVALVEGVDPGVLGREDAVAEGS